jgi:D-arabinose 1-dehydrogenase
MSKCGRYGPEKTDFDYSPTTLRKSLARTLERLGTSYLDTLYLHDVEFVASPVHPADPFGDPIAAIETEQGRSAWGLRPEDGNKIHGDGDEQILTAFGELRKMKDEGLVRSIGITGEATRCYVRGPN